VPLYSDGRLVWGTEPGAGTPDTTAPTVPGTPVASSLTPTSVTLSWAASTDTGGSGLAGYDVSEQLVGSDAIFIRPATGASLALTGLSPGRSYQFRVLARDGAGNRSTFSPVLTVTTPPVGEPDTTAPTRPGTPTASAISSSGATLAWGPSTDAVGVTGYRVYREAGATDVLLGTVTGTTYPVTGLSPEVTYQFYVVALDAAGNLSPASAPVAVTTSSAPPTSPCKVGYSVNDWGSGFTGTVTITNTGTATVNGWNLAFTFPGNQRISQGWSATVVQTGAAVTATSLAYNGTLAAGASTSFGFNGSYTGSNPKPLAFTLNGVACTIA